MFVENVSLLAAFGAGLLSFFSPCILPLIPVYIFYISGTAPTSIGTDRRRAVIRTLGFVIGFTLIFMLMGSTATAIGRLFLRYRLIFTKLSAVLLFFFGLQMLGVIRIPFLSLEKRLEGPKTIQGWASSILLGMAFAAGWSPCFGPMLASILMLASQSDSLARGMFLLFIYAMGMGIPFIVTAFFVDQFKGFLKKNQRLIEILPKIGGLVFIIFSLLLFFNQVGRIASWFM